MGLGHKISEAAQIPRSGSAADAMDGAVTTRTIRQIFLRSRFGQILTHLLEDTRAVAEVIH